MAMPLQWPLIQRRLTDVPAVVGVSVRGLIDWVSVLGSGAVSVQSSTVHTPDRRLCTALGPGDN